MIILSNIDRAGFAASNQRLLGQFAAVITAEDVGAYKPADNHFQDWTGPWSTLVSPANSCSMWRRAWSTTTSQPGATAWPRSGSTGDTTDPAGRNARAQRQLELELELEFPSMRDFAAAVTPKSTTGVADKEVGPRSR